MGSSSFTKNAVILLLLASNFFLVLYINNIIGNNSHDESTRHRHSPSQGTPDELVTDHTTKETNKFQGMRKAQQSSKSHHMAASKSTVSQGSSNLQYQPKIAYVFAGGVRSFICPKVHWSIRNHLIDALGGEPYVFIRVSSEDNKNTKTGTGINFVPDYQANEIEETLKVLNPIEVQMFTFANQTVEMEANYPGWQHQTYRENDLRRYSMFFHRCMGYKLVQNYEKEHNMRFDWVVLVRLDAQWLEPINPIQFFPNDRVYITETGYALFNDQFMLIPRQYSDYMYDLNTKAQKDVYCLGGPDVEKWKCNATESANRGRSPEQIERALTLCCPSMSSGLSEIIHMKHLAAAKIPVSMHRFPVYLTRRRFEDGSCYPECFRLYVLRYKDYIYRLNASMYKYYVPTDGKDGIGRAISTRDRTLCLLNSFPIFPWQPLSAARLHEKLKPNVSGLASLPIHGYEYSSTPSYMALDPSLMFQPYDRQLWRIHPTWNSEGCLTFSFQFKNNTWRACWDHSAHFYTRFNPQQLFWLRVVPHIESEHAVGLPQFNPANHRSSVFSSSFTEDALPLPMNTTRVMIPDGTADFFDTNDKVMCLTTTRRVVVDSPVTFQECVDDIFDLRQLFLTVQGTTPGTNYRSTVGTIRLASNPNYCVGREADIDYHNMEKNDPPTMSGLMLYPTGDDLFVAPCRWGGNYHLVQFEFELIE